ncbi:MAG: hypothetical protein K6U87_05820 [Firmicutes bacterium]|nr:hypothetical protein [Bacillota bacterium]
MEDTLALYRHLGRDFAAIPLAVIPAHVPRITCWRTPGWMAVRGVLAWIERPRRISVSLATLFFRSQPVDALGTRPWKRGRGDAGTGCRAMR